MSKIFTIILGAIAIALIGASVYFIPRLPSIFKDIQDDMKKTLPSKDLSNSVQGKFQNGEGISISDGQYPTIANTGVLSFQGKSGNLELASGSGILIEGLEITNIDPGSAQRIFGNISVDSTILSATTNTDTFYINSGNGINLITDPINKKITINNTSGGFGWSDDGAVVRLSDGADNVGVNTSSPTSKFQVEGTVWLRGNNSSNGLYVDSSGKVGIGTLSPSDNLDVSGKLRVNSTGVGLGTSPISTLSFASSTVPAGGIDFGGDTTLYRSAAGTLQTDNTFKAYLYRSQGVADTWTYDLASTVSTANGYSAWGRDTASRQAFGANVSGDSSWRFIVQADGKILWGNGTTQDTNLYRSAADTLKTDDSFVVDGNLTVNGAITGPSSGASGYWTRSSTTLSPTTSGDSLTTTGNISTTSSGTITSASTLTASNGLTMTTGALSLTSTSGSAALTLSSSTTAFNVNSGLFDIDTTNSRVGVGTTPSYRFDVAGTADDTASKRAINSVLTYTGASDIASDYRFTAGNFRLAVAGSKNVTAGFDNFSNILSNPYFNMTTNPTVQAVYGVNSILEFTATNSNTITTYNGIYSQAYAPSGNTTTITNLNWINTGYFNNSGTLTIGTQKGLSVQSMAAGTINYGIHVATQTNGTSDYGIRLDAADTQTLWISGNADNTTAAAGIAFGSSRDTNLYRSAADRLQTDDDFYAQRLRLTGTANTWAIDLTNAVSTSNGFSAWGRDSASRQIFGSQITGETSWRYIINADGKTEWGDGGVTRDTNLYRSAADTLKTDDAFVSGATLTASNGFTMTTGALSLTATSGSLSATGLSSASLSVTSGTLALATATSGNITLTTGATTGLVNILTGNLKIGGGTPGVTLDGDDAYITGTLEVDGTSEFDGRVGIGSAAPSSNMLKVSETKTNTSGFDATAIIQDTGNPSADSSMTFIGNWTKALTGSGNAQNFTGGIVGTYSEAIHQGTATLSSAYAFQANPKLANTGTITNAIGLLVEGQMTAVGTIGTRYGVKIANFDNSGGGTLTTNYGLRIDPQTAGSSDYGIAIGASDTQTLQISYNADNTTAAAGIAFGSSRDTNLYRSAANTLKTDGAFVTGSTLDIGSVPSTGSYTAALCWDNSGASQIQDCVGSVSADYAEIYPVASGVEYGEIVTISNDLVEVNFTETDDNGNPLSPEKRKVSRLVKSNKPYDGKVIGITSKNYGDFSSVGHNSVKKEDNPMSIALNGRVPVKVSAENGDIEPGDYLTSSSIPGVAMKSSRAGQVIGKALDSYSGSGIGKILVFVSVSYADPNRILDNLAISEDGQLISTKANLPNISSLALSSLSSPNSVVTPQNSTPFTNTQSSELNDKINALSDRLSQLESQRKPSESSYSASLKAQTVEIDDNDSGYLRVRSKPSTTGTELSKLPTKKTYSVTDEKNGWYQINYEASDSAKLGWVKGSYVTVIGDSLADYQNNSTASSSANLAFADVLGLDKILDATPSDDIKSVSSLEISDTLKTMNLNVSGIFKSLGDTYLGKTLIAGDLTVDGTLSITDGNSLSVIGTLYLQKGTLADNLDLFNGAVTINKSGKITAKEIETDKIKTEHVSVGSKTLGSGVIPSGQTSITVSNDQVGDSSNIFITPNSQTGGQALVVSSQETGKGFTITLDHSYSADIKFKWWIVDNK